MTELAVDILGPLRVSRAGAVVPLGAARQQALLALLALAIVVLTSLAGQILWGDSIVWGTMSDGDQILWGTLGSGGDQIIWGD